MGPQAPHTQVNYVERELGFTRNAAIGTLAPTHGQATVQTSKHNTSPLPIVNGPLVKAIDLNFGNRNTNGEGQPLLILCPQHARLLANGGYSKVEVKRYVWEHARIPFGSIPRGNLTSFSKKLLAQTADGNPDFPVPIAEKPEDIVIVVMGGSGTHSLSVQTRLASENVTVPILRKDGTPWRANT